MKVDDAMLMERSHSIRFAGILILALCVALPVFGSVAGDPASSGKSAAHPVNIRPIPFDKLKAKNKKTITVGIEKRTPDARAPSLKLVMTGGKYSGVEYVAPKLEDWSSFAMLSLIVVMEQKMELRFTIDDETSCERKSRFRYSVHLPKGWSLIQIPVSDLASRLDLKKMQRLSIYAMNPVPGSVVWIEKVQLGDALPKLKMTREMWDMNPDLTIPNPFNKPDPDIVLWHAYNEKPGVEDVLDFSRHGNIGEFRTADKIPTGKPDTKNRGLRLYGDALGRGKCVGYAIMPSDTLSLKQGTVSFWMVIDGNTPVRKGIVLAAGSKAGRKANIAVSVKKDEASIAVSFGKKIEAKNIPVNRWVHVAWTFDKKTQALFIDGKPVKRITGGASLNGANGFYVGQDGSRWERDHAGGSGFAGTLDDLRIFNKKVADFPGLKNPPDSALPALGIVAWYTFDSDTASDCSGMTLNALDENIAEKNVEGWTAWKKNDKAWVFTEDRKKGGSFVEIPTSPLLNLTDGTLELRFKINRYSPTGYFHSWYVLSVFSHASAPQVFPARMVTLTCFSKGAKKYDPTQPAGMKLTFDATWNNDLKPAVKPDTVLKAGEWIRLVAAWHWDARSLDSFADIWINDVYQGRFNKSIFRLFGDRGPIRLGTYPHKATFQLGADMTVTDFKILNYRRSAIIPDTNKF